MGGGDQVSENHKRRLWFGGRRFLTNLKRNLNDLVLTEVQLDAVTKHPNLGRELGNGGKKGDWI